jgi:hypothetical protein
VKCRVGVEDGQSLVADLATYVNEGRRSLMFPGVGRSVVTRSGVFHEVNAAPRKRILVDAVANLGRQLQ